LPTDSPAFARRLFTELVNDHPYVLFVTLHTGAQAEKLVTRAAALAGTANSPRWVVWARKPNHIADVIAECKGHELITGGTGSVAEGLDTLRGFSMSLGDEVRDVIKLTDPEPSYLRIIASYAKAEKMG
ncbi:MAG TPA: hypothetical protein VLB27_00230, partial [candidate division Zixibacteria bacterium]|nr:hypothetical protein [candidate division Zixibacteria bacterium]